jgi:hypothetical protein
MCGLPKARGNNVSIASASKVITSSNNSENLKKPEIQNRWARVLGREFGVSATAILKRFGSQTKTVKLVANQLFEAENALNNLPLSLQYSDKFIFVHIANIYRTIYFIQ